MAAEWWWPSLAAAWLGSEAAWFLVLNVVIAAIAVLSSRARPSASPRSGGVTRRASSALLQRLRSFSIFSYPSACFDTPTSLQPAAAHAAAQETEEPATMPVPSPHALVVTSQPAPAADEEEEDPSAMSMEDAYALVLASRSRRPPEPARRSDVDAEAEDLRQQRLNSIFNYTQMLKQRAALRAGRRQTDARRDQL
ncbi:hypothetical protein BDA96_02G193800 [Sorghum bicolor]|jgi:hypothetical protein|uniref:DUF4408 domain-containing protein n=2 Tax=Sorghum bicolor TaxID=4558 RepID=A0A921RMX7_SORBI|nr:uncharacterized protein LOC8056169 [Sorghum bicolor]EER96648.1 hypothetical protein SORBI_3002G183100 [Sorghum bicolor]KAG0543479.1 hypothetical protein BDA96_02G193800 [Sorghum bicolor]|eukprot:XP_002460127.1 uncharacterized protein LOC8056169 [Sorghum bicolor]